MTKRGGRHHADSILIVDIDASVRERRRIAREMREADEVGQAAALVH